MKHSKNIHLVYIITQLELGGAQKICLTLFNQLKDQSIHTMLIAGPHGPLATQDLQQNPDVFLLPELKQSPHGDTIMHEIRCFIAMMRLLKKLKKQYPSLMVHTHSTKAGILGRWAAFFIGITTRIHTVHGYAIHNHSSWLFWLFGYVCELITRFITTHMIYVSSYDQSYGQKLFFIPSKKTSLIRAAVDTHHYHAAIKSSLPHHPFIFGSIACFKPQKNLFDLLESFYRVYQKNNACRLEIIGDGFLRSSIETWIHDRNLAHCITLHGWQPNVADYMRNWHTFVLTSLWEGLPCAVVEARLMRLPVISYITGGIPEVIIHNKNGLLIQQKDIVAFSNAMLSLMHNQSLYYQLSNYADNLHSFAYNQMFQAHKKIYFSL